MKFINNEAGLIIKLGRFQFGRSRRPQPKPYFATFNAGGDAYVIYRASNLISALWLALNNR